MQIWGKIGEILKIGAKWAKKDLTRPPPTWYNRCSGGKLYRIPMLIPLRDVEGLRSPTILKITAEEPEKGLTNPSWRGIMEIEENEEGLIYGNVQI